MCLGAGLLTRPPSRARDLQINKFDTPELSLAFAQKLMDNNREACQRCLKLCPEAMVPRSIRIMFHSRWAARLGPLQRQPALPACSCTAHVVLMYLRGTAAVPYEAGLGGAGQQECRVQTAPCLLRPAPDS